MSKLNIYAKVQLRTYRAGIDTGWFAGRILIFAIKGFRWHKQVPSEAFLFTRVITGYEVTGTSWVRKDSFQSA